MSTAKKSRRNHKHRKNLHKPVRQDSTPKELSSVQAEQSDTHAEQSDVQAERSDIQAEQGDTQEKKKPLEPFVVFISVAAGLATVLSVLFNIDDKPSVSVWLLVSLSLILSPVIGIGFFYHKSAKTATDKEKTDQHTSYLLFGLLFILGVFILITKSHPNMENQDNSPQQFENYEFLRELHSTQQTENNEQQLLMQAELYYNGEKYESLVELYSLEALRENPIALNNLGYMYSKGIYFEQNFDVAIQYYENASKKGLDDALHNLVSLKLHNCKTFQEVVDVLRTGYNNNDGGTFLFLGSILEEKDLSETKMTDRDQTMIKAEIESFFEADNETQAEVLSASLGPWEYKTIISDNVPYGGGHTFERYILLSEGYVYNGRGISRTYKYDYEISTRTFLYNNLMQECFVSVTDPE